MKNGFIAGAIVLLVAAVSLGIAGPKKKSKVGWTDLSGQVQRAVGNGYKYPKPVEQPAPVVQPAPVLQHAVQGTVTVPPRVSSDSATVSCEPGWTPVAAVPTAPTLILSQVINGATVTVTYSTATETGAIAASCVRLV